MACGCHHRDLFCPARALSDIFRKARAADDGQVKLLGLALVLISSEVFAQSAPTGRAPVDPALADYQRSSPLSGVVRTVGSSTLSNLLLRWAAEFQRLYPSVQIQVTGGGSESAVPALIEGRADLGPMSRPMNNEEIERFRAKFGYAPTQLTAVFDAVAVYVNKRNPLNQVSFRELDGIYSATRKLGGAAIRQWGQLGLTGEWKTRRIEIKGPSAAQGIYGVFRSTVLANGEFRLDMRPEPVAS